MIYFQTFADITITARLLVDKRNILDVVIMCGSPGSGKSTLYWEKLKPLGYERVNQDILKTVGESIPILIYFLTKCFVAREMCENGYESVVREKIRGRWYECRRSHLHVHQT